LQHLDAITKESVGETRTLHAQISELTTGSLFVSSKFRNVYLIYTILVFSWPGFVSSIFII